MRAIPWPLVIRYAYLIVPVVLAGLRAGKPWPEILADIWLILKAVRAENPG